MKHGVFFYENATDSDEEVVNTGGGPRRSGGSKANCGISNIIFDSDNYTLKIVMDDGRIFTTGSIRGEKGEQGDGYNASVIQALEDHTDAVQFNTDAAVGLLINAYRQLVWDQPIYEDGSVSLTNTLDYPFNNSKKSVALNNTQPRTSYVVLTEIVSADGNPGEVVVSDRLINGFKVAYTGSAKSAVVNYYVIGGTLQ